MTAWRSHASPGVIRMWYEWDWKDAEREFLRAIELKPGQPVPHIHYSLLLVQSGRFEEAEEQIRLALASDPLSVPANVLRPASITIAATMTARWSRLAARWISIPTISKRTW